MVPLFKIGIFCILSIGGWFYAAAQEIKVKRVELEHENIYLIYDLQDTTRGRVFTINVYSSKDNFINPLKHVSGDLGLEIPPGNNRRVVVNAKEEFGADFNEKLAFEVRAKVYVPFVRLEGFTPERKFKRLKHYDIHWSGGRPQNVLTFDLYRGAEKVHTFSGIANEGKYNLLFPAHIKPARNYHFEVTDSKNKDEIVKTGLFSIQRKLPLLLKIFPAVTAGVVGYLLMKPEEDCADCLDGFPTPPPD